MQRYVVTDVTSTTPPAMLRPGGSSFMATSSTRVRSLDGSTGKSSKVLLLALYTSKVLIKNSEDGAKVVPVADTFTSEITSVSVSKTKVPVIRPTEGVGVSSTSEAGSVISTSQVIDALLAAKDTKKSAAAEATFLIAIVNVIILATKSMKERMNLLCIQGEVVK